MKHPDKPFGCVVWDDAVAYQEEVDESDIPHAPSRFHDYGWIIRSDNRGITIASDWRPSDGKYRQRTFIPRPMVIEEQLYVLVKPRKKRQQVVPQLPKAG